MNDFEIIKKAYEDVGYTFAIKESSDEEGGIYKYIFLCNEDTKLEIENMVTEQAVIRYDFLEFNPDGSWGSY